MIAAAEGEPGSPTRNAGIRRRQGAVPADISPAPARGQAPVPDRESGPFWAGLAGRRIVVQACVGCGRHRFPRMPSCPYCGAPGGTDVVVPGTGTVYSWIRAHRHLSGAGDGDLPYAIVTVELDTGPRLVGRLEPPDRAAIGLSVRPLFVDHPGAPAPDAAGPGRPGWTELRFEPDERRERDGTDRAGDPGAAETSDRAGGPGAAETSDRAGGPGAAERAGGTS